MNAAPSSTAASTKTPRTDRRSSDFTASQALRVERRRAGGHDWHVERRDGSPTCLLLHGTGASAHSFARLASRLAPDTGLVVPDLPGHARTRALGDVGLSLPAVARAIGDLLDELDCTPEVVIGHSAGAAIGAILCLDHHPAATRLVSINGAILPLGGALGRLFSPLARAGVGMSWVPTLFARRARDETQVRRILTTTGSHIDDEMVHDYGRLFRDREHAAGVLRLMASWRLEPLVARLPELQVATSLVAGDADGTIPLRHAYRLDALLPNSSLTILPAVGHLLHEERADLAAALIHDLPEMRP